MRREILFQIEGQKTQDSFVDFKFFARKAGAKAPAQRRAGVFRGAQKPPAAKTPRGVVSVWGESGRQVHGTCLRILMLTCSLSGASDASGISTGGVSPAASSLFCRLSFTIAVTSLKLAGIFSPLS
jgi:hypothetical protein